MEVDENRLRSGISPGASWGSSGGSDDISITSWRWRKAPSVSWVCNTKGASGKFVCRMKSTITLRIYFTQESSRGGGSRQNDSESEGLPSSLVKGSRLQREAKTIDNTFKIKSWDCRTSIAKCPVRESVCYARKKDYSQFLPNIGHHIPSPNDLIIQWEPTQSYPMNLLKVRRVSQSFVA